MVASPFTRREFISTTAAAGAGLILSSSAKVMAQASGTNDKLNIALIGFGAQGRVLLESLLKIEGIRLAAIVDIWEYALTYGKRYLKAMGVEVNAYENYEDLLEKEKDLQAVIVATPDFWHAPITNACLKAGLDVYCEKMMSNTIEGARSMVQTMRQTGKLLQIGHQRRSNPRYMFALNRLLRESKLCGRLTAAQAQWNRAATEDFGWPKRSDMKPEHLARYGFKDMHQFRNWRWFKELGGGPLSDLGAHQIDIFNWWFGVPPRAVLGSGGVDYYANHEWYDNAMVIYEYVLPEGVARAFYQVHTTTSAGGGYFEYFMGDEGSIKMSENPNLTVIYREARAPSWDALISKNYLRAKAMPVAAPTENTKVDVRETLQLAQYEIPVTFNKLIHQPHLENFFNTIRGKAKLNCPADEAFASEYVIFKANEAIAAQKTIDISKHAIEA
ncbi:MAG TPA: Gfo/Idh/MocA family oxidoreductase [Verrucomicrobiota bacterium]|nr:Gfo/Idh/MocA family oxidoreductase [Verrucomicrobiota bacterium]